MREITLNCSDPAFQYMLKYLLIHLGATYWNIPNVTGHILLLITDGKILGLIRRPRIWFLPQMLMLNVLFVVRKCLSAAFLYTCSHTGKLLGEKKLPNTVIASVKLNTGFVHMFIQVNYKGYWIKVVFVPCHLILYVLLQGLEHRSFSSVQQQRVLGIES